jgi:DNA mismatch repair protein MutL
MSKVRLLPKETAELIAAGEVIERPASVAKELIENAIDSGATKITIEIRGGGVAFLRVTDDGSGIAFEDVPIAFLRHATSKISKGSDLDAIFTLGFRGEALASVCAVSRTELFTKEKDVGFGTHYVISGGVQDVHERVGCPDGTSIIIRDLFYNVPARLKFLHKDVSESNAVAAIVNRIALSHPEIAFSFIRDNKRELQTTGDGDLFADIHAVLGRQFAASLIPVEFDFRGIKVSGYTSRPLFARGNRSHEYFFVNGRAIRSFVCMNAAEEAYKNSIMGGRFPACVIHMTLPPEILDVNAHPAKLEVKFSDDKLIYDSIFFAIKNALISDAAPIEIQSAPSERTLATYPQAQSIPSSFSPGSSNKITQSDYTQIEFTKSETIRNTFTPTQSNPQYSTADLPPNNSNILSYDSVNANTLTHNNGNDHFRYLAESAFLKKTDSLTDTAGVLPGNNTVEAKTADDCIGNEILSPEQDLKLVGEAFLTYIFCEYKSDLYVIDKHAAHERIIFEKLKSTLKSGNGNLSCQYIFGEKPLAVSDSDSSTAVEFREALFGLGFEYTVKANVITFTGIPSILSDTDGSDIENTFCEILDNLTKHKNDPLPELIDETLHSIACKAAIKGNRFTDPEELLSLANRVLTDNTIRYCPHGRPVIFKITQRELEKHFKRIQ